MVRLDEAFRELDRFREAIPHSLLQQWAERTDIRLEELRPYMQFHPQRYLRNSMHIGPAYQALVLCWKNGQRSLIHDHQGSSCVLKVVEGVATETTFLPAPNGMIYPTQSRELPRGYLCVSRDSDIHQVSNLQAGDADLVTFHLYSPPLLTMNVYSLEDGAVRRFDDPVNYDFLAGAGI